MDTRSREYPGAPRPAPRRSIYLPCWSLFLFSLILLGCGAPGEPLPPTPPIPVAVTDLSVRQAGDSVLLGFTLPNRSTQGDRLAEAPALEILRGSLKPDGTADQKSFRVVDTVPGSLVSGYLQRGKVEFPDPIPPEETRPHPGEILVYRVRTRISERKPSAFSNEVSLRVFPVPQRINESLEARVTETGVQLNWVAPARTSGGDPLSAIQEYHIYRGELDAASTDTESKDRPRVAVWKSALFQIGSSPSPDYLDTAFEFGKTYGYIVRSVISVAGAPLESGNSRIVSVTPRDTFAPAAPQGIVAAVLPGETPGSLVVDLSWSINVEPDLAGYRIYRSEQEGARGPVLTQDLLPTPAYRDISVQSGKRYWYSVSAVDRAGNESPLSVPASVDVAQPSP
jgi:hypothetical protein